MPTVWQFGFQDSATAMMEGMIDLHHDIMCFIVWIVIFVALVMFRLVQGELKNVEYASTWKLLEDNIILPPKIQHNTFMEIVWTVIPCIILLLISIPSFSLLYVVEDLNIIESSLKIIGNQWFWTYEFPSEFFEKKFDSVMIPEEDLIVEGSLRLLEVDQRLCLPIEKQMRLFMTATDVLHSWAIPSLGVKMDATPGRLNQVALWIKRTGVYYGQCSEMCGINHAFMPMVINAVEENQFLDWLIPNDFKF